MRNILKFIFLLLLPFVLNAKINFSQSSQIEFASTVNIVSLISNTIHSLQQERGLSTGYVSAHGEKFGDKLHKSQLVSDKDKEKLLHELKSQGKFSKTSSIFDDLVALRQDVKSLTIDFSKTYSKYTQIITFLLLQISNISDNIDNKELNNALYSYSTLLMYKESIGQKRAALSGLFAQKEPSKEIYEYFLSADIQEKIYLKSFLHGVDKKTITLYHQTLDIPSIKKVQEYEKIALEKLNGAKVNVNPEIWFQSVTVKINLVQDIEHNFFDDIKVLVRKLNLSPQIVFTKEEQIWIKNHPVIRIANEKDYPPWDFQENGKPKGYSIEYIQLLANKAGLKIKYVTDSWINLIKKIKSKEIDIIHTMYKNSIHQNLIFVAPYKKVLIGLYVKKTENNINNIDDLIGKKVSIPEGDSTIKGLEATVGHVENIYAKGYVDALKNVTFSKADATLLDMAVGNYLIAENTIPNIKIIGEAKINKKYVSSDYYLVVHESNKLLASILKKLVDSVSIYEERQISQRWLPQTDVLVDDKNLNIAFNFNRPPFMFGETSSKGIESDLVKEILESRGYKVKISQMSKGYLENILYEQNDMDGVSAITARDDNLFYSDDFISFVNYVVTRKKDNIKIDSILDLSNINFVSWKGSYNDLGREFYKLFNPINGTAKQSYSDSASQADDIKKFFDKKTDAMVIDKTIFEWYKLKYKNFEEYEFHKIFPKITSYPIAFKSQRVRDEFNTGLKELKKSGRYDEIIQFYLEEDIQPLLKFANLIANISGKFMFDEKPKELQYILKEFFQHPDIADIKIFSNIKNKSYLTMYKKDGKILSKISEINNEYLPSITKDIYFSNKGTPSLIGKLTIHYQKNFTNKKAILIPQLSTFTGLEDKDKKEIEESYKKFDLNIKTIELTKDEKEWLKLHQIIRFTGDPDWLPFEAFNEKGEYIGIVSEYLNKLESLIGIKFDRISPKSWSDSVLLSETKSVDVLSETTDSNRKNLIFTKPYITNDIVIVMKKEHRYVEGLKAIKNKKIALIKDYGYIEQIKQKYPNIDFYTVNTVSEGLTAVSIGRIDALVCTFALGSYRTTIMGISNIKIVGKTEFTTSLGLGVREDYAPFVNILNKAIDSISQEEHTEIFHHWIKQEYVEKVDYSLLYKVGGGAFILILLFVFWNRKMAKEIAKRKVIEAKMKETQERLSLTIAGSGDGLWDVDYIHHKLWWSPQFKKILGYKQHELNIEIEEWVDYLHPNDKEIVNNAYSQHLENDAVYDIVFRMIHKTGVYVWIRARAKTLRTSDGKPVRTSGSVSNITEMKKAQKALEDSKIELNEERNFISSIISSSQDALIVVDKESIITTWNDSATQLFGYERDEMIGQSVEKIIPQEYKELHQKGVENIVVGGKKRLIGKGATEIEGLHKDGTILYIDLALNSFMINNEMFFSANIRDIRERKELIETIKQEKQFTQTLIDSQEQLIITTDGENLLTANETFFDFFAVDSVEDFMQTYNMKCICEQFNTNAPDGYLQVQIGHEKWIDYVISRSFGEIHKAMISRGKTDFIFSVTATKLPGDDGIKSAVFTNITEMENAKLELESINQHTKESIEYASLIQGTLIPDNKLFQNYFQDYFTIWQPKDIVGGDIYLFEEIRGQNECLLMVIDCTGHGVAGAFVTMLVKAIERQIVAKINYSNDVVSPAKILSVFNKNMKQLLKQESINSISNAGFDGSIVYYNKKEKILKYAGAETPLFYIEDEELKIIKGNRYSVGYKKCDMEYEYEEHIIEVKKGMQFYLTTDGFIDQNGGEKSFPFGKKRFKKIIKENHIQAMPSQKDMFLAALNEYKNNEEANDDITLVGIKI